MTRRQTCGFSSEAKHGQAARRPLAGALVFILFAALPLAAQNRSEPARQALPSPYLIESLIDLNEEIDLKQVWRMLNVEPLTDQSYKCDGDCEAEVFDLAASNENNKTVALRISLERGHFFQYMIFRQMGSSSARPGEWKRLGVINCSDQRDKPPGHRVEQGDGRLWFVVRASSSRAAGAAVYNESWYEMQENAVKEVLSYPAEGDKQPCQERVGQSYKSLLLRHDLDNGTYTIPVQFLVAYDISTCDRREEPPALFARGLKAFYVWNEEKQRFMLDEARSEITAQQIARLSDAQGFSDAAFVNDNFQELSRIATSGDARRKAWLRNFLARMPDAPRKADLQRLLQQ
jgi:hypothetical protein